LDRKKKDSTMLTVEHCERRKGKRGKGLAERVIRWGMVQTGGSERTKGERGEKTT